MIRNSYGTPLPVMISVRVALSAVCLMLYVSVSFGATPPRTVAEQTAWEEKYDIQDIRHDPTIKTDQSTRFLEVPDYYSDIRDFDIAKTPPIIDFAVVTCLEPEYLPWGTAKDSGGAWGGWGDVSKGPDGCFYFSLSNHQKYGAESYILRYDPETKTQEIVLSAKDLCGWGPDDFGDGKIHGDIDFSPEGNTYVFTYFGPVPKQREWDTVYRGSHLLHYNCFTGDVEDLGIPLEGDSWPYHNYDWRRNLAFAVGHSGNIVIYDTARRSMIYGGVPPDGIGWYRRCILMDSDTGAIYTTDENSKDKQFICYTRRNNTFTRMNAHVPVNPNTGKVGDCRAHSERRNRDGAYWCFDFYGTIFTFNPDTDKTEYVTENWGREGYYTANLAMSPGGRYLYYIPGVAYQYGEGVPIVQYDTVTNRKKVLAFIHDYYLETYGYSPIRPYGIELDEKGESLFFYVNGGFAGDEISNGWMHVQDRRPGIYHIHIPASEREE